jgi:hypothetical protein
MSSQPSYGRGSRQQPPVGPPSGQPLSPPPAVSGPDRIGTIASAVIGVVCLIVTIGVIAFTSDDVPSGSTSPGPVAAGSHDLPGVADGGSSAANGSADPSAQLKRSFPVPPGATKSHFHRDLLGPGDQAWDVYATLQTVRAYYDRTLPKLGYTYDDPLKTIDRRGRVIGWHGSVESEQDDNAYAYLSLNTDAYGQPPGIVTITVTFS